MPSYVNSAFQGSQLLVRGVASYLFGSYNYKQGNTVMSVSNVALTSNVATLTVQITAGEVPLVGSLISVQQTASTSGLFNVNRVALTGVTIDGTTGAGTVTFALTHANVTSAPDAGSAVVEVPEKSETLANGASIAVACTMPFAEQFTVPLAVTFPGGVLPTAVTVTLQVALRNVDSEFTNTSTAVVVATAAYTTGKGPVVEATLERGYFYRVLVSGLTIGSATGVIAKIGG